MYAIFRHPGTLQARVAIKPNSAQMKVISQTCNPPSISFQLLFLGELFGFWRTPFKGLFLVPLRPKEGLSFQPIMFPCRALRGGCSCVAGKWLDTTHTKKRKKCKKKKAPANHVALRFFFAFSFFVRGIQSFPCLTRAAAPKYALGKHDWLEGP